MSYRAFVQLRRLSIALSVLGLAVAAYLVVLDLTSSSALCTGGCDIVRQSRYAQVAGIPVAAIGALGYLAILGVLALEEIRSALSEHGPALVLGLTLVGTLYSIYLTYLELFVIRAVCPYCFASALIMLALFGLAIAREAYMLRE